MSLQPAILFIALKLSSSSKKNKSASSITIVFNYFRLKSSLPPLTKFSIFPCTATKIYAYYFDVSRISTVISVPLQTFA
jgi:hypothetical protein